MQIRGNIYSGSRITTFVMHNKLPIHIQLILSHDAVELQNGTFLHLIFRKFQFSGICTHHCTVSLPKTVIGQFLNYMRQINLLIRIGTEVLYIASGKAVFEQPVIVQIKSVSHIFSFRKYKIIGVCETPKAA